MRRRRFRFSVRSLLACLTLVSVVIGVTIGFARSRLARLEELHGDGVFVMLHENPPRWARKLPIQSWRPFFVDAHVTVLVTPRGSSAATAEVSREVTERVLLSRLREARSAGADVVGLGVDLTDWQFGSPLGDFNRWLEWGERHFDLAYSNIPSRRRMPHLRSRSGCRSDSPCSDQKNQPPSALPCAAAAGRA